jgi:hypothetical protein
MGLYRTNVSLVMLDIIFINTNVGLESALLIHLIITQLLPSHVMTANKIVLLALEIHLINVPLVL